MTTSALPIQHQVRPAVVKEDPVKEAAAIAEFLMFEQCVRLCESLADQLMEGGAADPLLPLLGDCTAACQNYQAAKLRGSSRQRLLAGHCVETLSEIAKSCHGLKGNRAKRCRMACAIGIAFLEGCSAAAAALRN